MIHFGRLHQPILQSRKHVVSTFVPTTFQHSRRKSVYIPTLQPSLERKVAASFFSSLQAAAKKDINSKQTFQIGDKVQINLKDDLSQKTGIIEECKKGGWYTVAVENESTIMKCRSNQIEHLSKSQQNFMTTPSTSSDLPILNKLDNETPQTPLPAPPTIHDLDTAIQEILNDKNDDNIENIMDSKLLRHFSQHHYKVKKWITFSDLHCSPASLSTCLDVLDLIHTTALAKKEENVGVLFLGDFWHHRGTLRVDCLNAILQSLSKWDVPMIMIPGNHDQITLGGHEHALTPLGNAYFISEGPGLLIFSHPTKFQNALFVPHIRNISIMQSILQSQIAKESSRAMLIHADITGAYMNDMILSTGGISPCYFPPNIPIYSGHFHKPHIVKSSDVEIRYIGSPYQTTLSEAGQQKSLLILDSEKGWNCVEEIPINNIGKQHFSYDSIDDFLEIQTEMLGGSGHNIVKPGDRVVLTVSQEEWEQYFVNFQRDTNNYIEGEDKKHNFIKSPFDEKTNELHAIGATVEIRQVKSLPEHPMMLPLEENLKNSNNSNTKLTLMEDLTPKAIFSSYLNGELERSALTNITASELLDAGIVLLEEEVETNEEIAKSFEKNNPSDLTLDYVSVQGLGPFKDCVKYPLSGRGMVLLRGTNKDGGFDSNGSGKTTLAMASLWALTGSMDPRPTQDSKVSDVIHDRSKVASVTLRGSINGSPFIIMRSKATNNKGSLTFHLNGEDLTAQSVKETQMLIDEKVGTSQILSRSIFHGQHAISGLLEATDAKFKEELSLVVPLSMWQTAASIARAKGREFSKQASELEGMLFVRSKDCESIKLKCQSALDEMQVKLKTFESKKSDLDKYLSHLRNDLQKDTNHDYNDLQNQLSKAQLELDSFTTNLVASESEFETISAKQKSVLQQTRQELHEKNSAFEASKLSFEHSKRFVDRGETLLSTLKSQLVSLKNKWNVSIPDNNFSSIEIDFLPPEICPTCSQPISVESSHGHTQQSLKEEIEGEFRDILRDISDASNKYDNYIEDCLNVEKIMQVHESERNYIRQRLEKEEEEWEDQLKICQSNIKNARLQQYETSKLVSHLTKTIQDVSQLKSVEQTKSSELERLEDSLNSSRDLYENIRANYDEMIEIVQNLEEQKDSAHRRSKTMAKLADAFGPRGVQSFVLQNAVHALQISSQSFLDVLSDGSLRLNLALDTSDRVSRTVGVFSDGTWIERPLSSLSGGQWRRCSLAMNLGFSDVVAKRGQLRTSLLVLDEPLTHLDSIGRAQVGQLLRRILQDSKIEKQITQTEMTRTLGIGGLNVSTILIILQDLAAEELEESFDFIDLVVKTSGCSDVITDG